MSQLPHPYLYRHHCRYYRDRAEEEARRRALLAEAEQGRLAAPARTAGRVALAVAAARWSVGALVRLGRGLQRPHGPAPATPAARDSSRMSANSAGTGPSLAALRTAAEGGCGTRDEAAATVRA